MTMFGALASPPTGSPQQPDNMQRLLALLTTLNQQNRAPGPGAAPNRFAMPPGGLMGIMSGKDKPGGLVGMMMENFKPPVGAPMSIAPPGIPPPTPPVPVPAAGPAGGGFFGRLGGLW